MKRLLVFALLLIALASPAFSQVQNSEAITYSAAQQELITLSEQWNDALARKDMAALERFLAADFYVSAAGALRKTERSVWLKNVEEMDWNALKYRNIKVDVYGDAAVMTALIDFKVTNRWGIPISTDTQVTDVWTRRNGQWQVAARHLGAASIGNYLRLAAGFFAGLVVCSLIWLLLRLRKRFAGRNKAVAS